MRKVSGRVVLHNPHSYWYKPTVFRHFNRSIANNKYEYIFDYMYNSGIVYVYLDEYEEFIRKPTLRVFYDWVLLNGLNPFRFRLVKSLAELHSQDILISFQYGHFNSYEGCFRRPREKLVADFAECKAFKVVHLTHFGYNTDIAAEYAKRAAVDLFVSESNLYKNSAYFRHYYPWYRKDVYVLPFVPSSRFQHKVSFLDRKNRAIATGSIAPGSKLVEEFFKSQFLQPMRKEIYQNQEVLGEVLDSYIRDFVPDSVDDNVRREGRNILLKHSFGRKAQYVLRYVAKAFCSYARLNYFRPLPSVNVDYDIVKFLNMYRMCVVPEEVIGLPGITFVEAMACGTAFVGIDSPMYTDLGMINGENYIAYDGTIAGLKEVLLYWQKNEKELQHVAAAGCKLVHQVASPEFCVPQFLETCRRFALER